MTSPFDFTGKAVFAAGGTSGINLGIAGGLPPPAPASPSASRSQQRVDGAFARSSPVMAARSWGAAADVRDYAAIARSTGRRLMTPSARSTC